MTADVEVVNRTATLTAGVRRRVPMEELREFFSHAFSDEPDPATWRTLISWPAAGGDTARST